MGADDAAAGQPPKQGGSPAMALVERNIEALVRRRQQQRRETALQDRIADAITAFAGSMKFVYLHLLIYGAWIVVNLGWVPPVPRFDETFVVLAMVASVEAIFISTFVLVSQNRMAAQADERADLDLQISLLAEHEITRLVTLVGEMARRMGVAEAHDPELEELKRDVAPEQVLDRMQQSERKLAE
ncbi:putative membrane protein [Variovorax sp. PBS-H4]|uniref:DUF1003 domain-containing protein n=1 Tax=Variovorax sp. PBS-H4 TaxID=434008 RepID=UPI001318A622|nr:DUF1003 domain-containing protein [Variovorax sp. PBS-H4]VTU41230.1 putative membrane protein [Variovorax sp. PBS-H4]